jgi:hypothetical protein
MENNISEGKTIGTESFIRKQNARNRKTSPNCETNIHLRFVPISSTKGANINLNAIGIINILAKPIILLDTPIDLYIIGKIVIMTTIGIPFIKDVVGTNSQGF